MIPVSIEGRGLRLIIGGRDIEVDAGSIIRVAPGGGREIVTVVQPGDAFAHTLTSDGSKVVEIELDPRVQMKLARLLREEDKQEHTEVTPAPETAPATPQGPTRRPQRARWAETGLTGPQLVTLGSRIYRLPAEAKVKFNGQPGIRAIMYVLVHDVVHVLGARGEMVLAPGEGARLARGWASFNPGST